MNIDFKSMFTIDMFCMPPTNGDEELPYLNILNNNNEKIEAIKYDEAMLDNNFFLTNVVFGSNNKKIIGI